MSNLNLLALLWEYKWRSKSSRVLKLLNRGGISKSFLMKLNGCRHQKQFHKMAISNLPNQELYSESETEESSKFGY